MADLSSLASEDHAGMGVVLHPLADVGKGIGPLAGIRQGQPHPFQDVVGGDAAVLAAAGVKAAPPRSLERVGTLFGG